jgi:hypothetical protein
MTSDTVIVSYAKRGREDYPSVLPRLVDAARAAGYQGDFLLCSPDGQGTFVDVPNSRDLPIPDHGTTPYGFKTHLIKIARDRGYKKVIWFDSTINVVRDFSEVIKELESRHVLLFDNPGCPESHWTSDDCLAKIGCSTDEAQKFNQVMACAMGFDFSSQYATLIFDRWFSFGEDGVSFKGASGSTRPEYRAHRHDQSVISFLAHSFKTKVVPYGFLSYWDDRSKFNSVLGNRGIGQP